jgi:outer membrane lipoprotein LolB
MRHRLRATGFALLLSATFFIAGCATKSAAIATFPAESQWSGRLALKIQGEPPQAFSADFELGGSPGSGLLAFYTPLGTTAARLQWAPGSASLLADGQTRTFASVGALVREATGAEVPVEALFDWLRGTATTVPGWVVDLSALDTGRLFAVREDPALPRIELRIVLQR